MEPELPETPEGLRCLDPNDEIEYVTWEFFYPDCSNRNLLCRKDSGAWVPAITVCNQQLD